EPEPERKSDSLKTLLSSPLFRCFTVMMVCAGASEIAMAEWASMFAQQALGVSKVVGDLAGPCAFAIFMGTGRILYARFSAKLSFRKTVIVLSALCAACYLTTALTGIPILALVSCAVCGFTVSVMWPGTYSAGAKAFPRGDAVMFSVFAMCGDLGCCLGPWILGIIADIKSLHTGFAVTALFPIIMLITAIFFFKEKVIKE
ncbi:MAG: MFS transporter, partial [Acutalibacteraceae bacterium]|nr:MFS transporter [Acutalibacteraceae bacterium]